MGKRNEPTVSLILPTLNSIGIVGNLLESIKAQTYPHIELIAVDAGSIDGTAEFVREFATHVIDFSIEPHMAWGTPYQDVLGAEKASGEFIYFVDSDMVLLPKAIETYVRQMTNAKADALIVPEISFGEGFWARCKVLERSAYLLGDSSIEAPRFIRKTVWNQSGGYDPTMGGLLDWDFHRRLRDDHKQIIRGELPVYHDEGRLTLGKLAKKKFTYGNSAGRYLSKHWRDKEVATSQFNLFRPVFLRNWKALVADPTHTAGFLVMKLAEGSAFAAGLAVARFGRFRANSTASKDA